MRFALLLLVVLLPVQATALSCLRPSVARVYAEAQAATEAYVAVRGHLQFDASLMPRTDTTDQTRTAPMTDVPARLRGMSLSSGGLNVPFDRPVTLEVACFGPWCGSAPLKSEVLAFVRKDAAGYAVAINPCGGFLFATPAPAQIRTLLACHAGAHCEDSSR